jgi:hypothetical protein
MGPGPKQTMRIFYKIIDEIIFEITKFKIHYRNNQFLIFTLAISLKEDIAAL